MNASTSPGRLGAGLLTLTLVLAACTSGAPAPPTSPTTPPPDAPVTAPPSDDPGIGTAPPPPIGAKPVLPRPGQIDVHPVAADTLEARVEASTIHVRAVWTSGVEPCTILDSIVVDKGEGTYTITLREGRGPEEIACIAIAEQHFTEFEIPDVAAGTWTISDSGGVATPVTVTVG